MYDKIYIAFSKFNLGLLIKNQIAYFFSFAIVVEDLNGKHRLATRKIKVWDSKKKDSRMI